MCCVYTIRLSMALIHHPTLQVGTLVCVLLFPQARFHNTFTLNAPVDNKGHRFPFKRWPTIIQKPFYNHGGTAEKMREFRLVVWGMHGIYGAGKTMDETFGLIETVEKAAQIYMLTAHLPRVNTIRDDQMVELAEFFGVKYRKDFLNL